MPKKKLKRWFVSAEVTISVGTYVEAATEKEARELAEDRRLSSAWRDDGDPDEEWTHDELDGTPKIISCDEEQE